MQAYKAYYDEGKFIPLEPVRVPKNSLAIVTILDFPINHIQKNYNGNSIQEKKAAMQRVRDLMAGIDDDIDVKQIRMERRAAKYECND